MTSRAYLQHSCFRNWWWVALFCLSAGVFYAQAMKTRSDALEELRYRMVEMEKQALVALMDKEDLKLQIASQSDPAWVELVLLRQMGVVPEGFIKVHFKAPS